MSDAIISVENLGKKYQIKHQATRQRYTALRDVIAARTKQIFTRNQPSDAHSANSEDFWALRDVSFEVKQGEVVGIIGRNGAGKSTLLKILSRITEPSEGQVSLRGRVASLLEVGTGFHPELTGRENIYLNGAILGMHASEIKQKFDEIVAFSGVENFLDTPVKRYSSGMYVRLAFAVAAHLEPEILIIDEVLAVGDAQFQKKCLGKMAEVAQAGRTVLFVSHNMEAIDRLTSRCLSLSEGTLNLDGKTSDVVGNYLRNANLADHEIAHFRVSSIPNTLQIAEAWAETPQGEKSKTFRQGEPMEIVLRVESTSQIKCDFAIVIENSQQHALYTTHLSDLSGTITTDDSLLLTAEFRNPMLRKGDYLVSIAAFSPDRRTFYDVIHHFPLFDVAGIRDTSFPDDVRWGSLYIPVGWKVRN